MKATSSSLRTRRFESFALSLLALVVLCVAAFILKVDQNVLIVALGSVNVLSLAALGFGNWHDRDVRMKVKANELLYGAEAPSAAAEINVAVVDNSPKV